MKKILCTTAALFFLAGSAYAVPFLQLDIEGGWYDTVTETIVASGDPFSLYALVDSTKGDFDLTGSYYLSVAVVPMIDFDADIGSFTFNGTSYDVTDDMTFGTPPIAYVEENPPEELPPHAIFPTYWMEFEFDLSSADRANLYNSQDDVGGTQGGLVWNTSGDLYVEDFAIGTALTDGYRLHFDLYTKKWDAELGELVIDNFAPFSHDAESIPEPTTMLLFGTGLAGLAAVIRRKRN